MAANNYTSAEWQAMSAEPPPYGAPLPQTGAPAPAPGLATRRNDWTTLRPPPQPHPQTTIGEMGGIMDLFDRLTDVVAQQRSSRVATNSYVLELEKLINKLRDCIDRLLALLQECRDNKEELERLRNRIEQHPNLNLIRDQLTDTIREMQNDQLDPDQFRAQLAELVGEIKRICDEVDNMRRAGFGNGGDGDDGDGYPSDDETKGNDDRRRGNRGRGGQKIQGDGSGRVMSMVAELERDDRDLPPNDPLRRTQAVSPEISRQGLYGNPISDGGQTRRMRAASRERQLRQGSGERVGFGSGVSTGRGLGGGWQTPEKLESLSKSKPIRTLDSIKKKKKAKRGNKSKRRRKKSKRRRNKKKKQTKKKRNKKRKKKRTRKR